MQGVKTQRDLKVERLQLLEKKKYMREHLPHLYGMAWYKWAWDFFQSRNKINLLCAANQISKSSTQIRKCIHWATDVSLWPELWKNTPTQFWYFYPTKDVAHAEYEEKWVKEWLPKGEMKNHPQYGWTHKLKNGQIHYIRFNSGVTVYFKSYEQGATNLQTSSVFAVFGDEEMPEEIYHEIIMRISSATIAGYFHMVFTATLGQEFWRLAIEEKGKEEYLPDAFKQQVSMYMCLQYMDGSLSPWTVEHIKAIEAACANPDEVNRRVYGRFVVDKDRKYQSFNRAKNLKLYDHPLPKGWLIYAGVDIGTGGTAHPAGIAFVAVKPDFSAGRVFKCWRGDGVTTTAGDILDKYLELRGNMKPVMQLYDHQSKDFHTIASRRGIPFLPADKARDSGEGTLNTLFKNEMLSIYKNTESLKLVSELETLKNSTPKPQAKDDLIDAVRFAVTKVPWDYSKGKGNRVVKKKSDDSHLTEREKYRNRLKEEYEEDFDVLADEIDMANELYDVEEFDDF